MAGNQRLPAHKIVLAASSNILLQLLEDSDEIDLSQFDQAVVEYILEFVYTGQTKIPVESEPKFYECAKKLEPEGLPMQFNKMLIPRTDNLADLPTEILIKIIKKIKTSDLLRNVSLVSKQMNVLSKDGSVEIRVNFDKNSVPETARSFFKQKSNQITSVIIGSQTNSEILNILMNHIQLLPKLKKLSIWDSKITIPKDFVEQLSSLKELVVLKVQSRLEVASLKTFSECKKLRIFVIRPHYYTVSDQDFNAISSMANHTELHLDFTNCLQNFHPEMAVAQFPVTRAKMLKHGLTVNIDNSISRLERIISHFPSVGSLLAFGGCQLDNPENIRKLHSVLLRCKNLDNFRLNVSSFDDGLFKKQFDGWRYEFDRKTNCLRMHYHLYQVST